MLAKLVALIVGLMVTAAQAEPKPFKDCGDCPQMVTIPAGRFLMGSDPTADDRDGTPADVAAMELPQHEVTFARSFAVSRTEITRAQYADFVRATGHADGDVCFVWNAPAVAWEKKRGITWRDPGFRQRDDEPAVCVSWNDAVAYAAWLAAKTAQPYRLLSEAEWEYAARAGTSGLRPSTAPPCTIGNVSDRTRARRHGGLGADPAGSFSCRDGFVTTAPVGRFQPNAFGLYDMIGNVWEWTADCEHESYVGAPRDGRPWLDAGDCAQRSNRGGSWGDPVWRTRAALREWDPADGRYVITGMRVARDGDGNRSEQPARARR